MNTVGDYNTVIIDIDNNVMIWGQYIASDYIKYKWEISICRVVSYINIRF
jgi:hypothetical protein